VDVNNQEELERVVSSGDVVLNTIGPFYRTALPVIDAAIKRKVHYIDINDDHDVAATLVFDPSYDERAKQAGTMILIGCGATPGFTNLLAKLACDRLDQPRTIRLCWVVPFFLEGFSPGIMDHLFHMLTGDVIQFIDGKHQPVAAYSGVRNVEFLPPFRTYPAYYSGHGEPVTLGHFIPGLEEATIRSYFFPQAADDLMRMLVDRGFGNREIVAGADISPLDFLTSYAATESGRASLGVDLQGETVGFASQVEVCGSKGADEVKIIFEEQGLLGGGESQTLDSTPVCARLALEGVMDGSITGTGFLAPEACIDPVPFINAVIAETGKSVHQREEIIRKNVFKEPG
jgi:saccharopine dehydrogenase-like NADP-dependent oxidoreductase